LARSSAGASSLQTNTTGFGANKKEEDLFTATDITQLLGLDKEDTIGEAKPVQSTELDDAEYAAVLLVFHKPN